MTFFLIKKIDKKAIPVIIRPTNVTEKGPSILKNIPQIGGKVNVNTFIIALFKPKIFPRFSGLIKSHINDVEAMAIAPVPKPTRKFEKVIMIIFCANGIAHKPIPISIMPMRMVFFFPILSDVRPKKIDKPLVPKLINAIEKLIHHNSAFKMCIKIGERDKAIETPPTDKELIKKASMRLRLSFEDNCCLSLFCLMFNKSLSLFNRI